MKRVLYPIFRISSGKLSSVLFYLALCLSIFIYTGYSETNCESFDVAIETELVDARSENQIFDFDLFNSAPIVSTSTSLTEDTSPFNKFSLRNLDQRTKSRLNFIAQESLLYDSDVFFFPFKVSLSEDDEDLLS